MYSLTFSPASPYVRKVILASHIAGISKSIKLLQPNEKLHLELKYKNSLNKIPVLKTPDNSYLFDSRVIIEFFNDISGNLYPKDKNKKFIMLKYAALAEGIIDAALLYVYSNRYSGDKDPSEVWQNHQLKKIKDTLNFISDNIFEFYKLENIYASHIGLIVALDYLIFRKIFDWKNISSNLINWHKELSLILPAYKETLPKDIT